MPQAGVKIMLQSFIGLTHGPNPTNISFQKKSVLWPEFLFIYRGNNMRKKMELFSDPNCIKISKIVCFKFIYLEGTIDTSQKTTQLFWKNTNNVASIHNKIFRSENHFFLEFHIGRVGLVANTTQLCKLRLKIDIKFTQN